MSKVIAFANQKGGAGKTSVTQHFGAILQEKGNKVLYIDLDVQGSLTMVFGAKTKSSDNIHIGSALLKSACPFDCIQETKNGDIIGSSPKLSTNENEIKDMVAGRELVLSDVIDAIKEGSETPYDYILVDTPPSLGILSINALAASDEVIVVTKPSVLDIGGISALAQVIAPVRKIVNPDLKVAGVVLNEVKNSSNSASVAREIADAFAKELDTKVFDAEIRGAEDVKYAQAKGQNVFDFKSRSLIVQDYRDLVNEYFASNSE